jgi:dipeptidyl aminopeptidase/acylaminoacyl peptidase
MPNYRGVNGQGWKLAARIGDWGVGLAFQDMMDGVDAVIGQGFVDPGRLGIGGWSNGGFMTEWAITHTNRFKAAVAEAGMLDFFSIYGTPDGNRDELRGDFDTATLRKRSGQHGRIATLKKLERLRGFFRFAHENAWLTDNPAQKLS